MTNISYLLIVVSIFFCILMCLILFFRNSTEIFSNRLLGGAFVGYIWYCVVLILNVTGLIRYIPHLFGSGIPLFYTAPVFAYLYVRSSLKNQRRFQRYDWLHFIPSIVAIILVSPFYFTDTTVKQELVEAIARNFNYGFTCKIGFISNKWHFYFRMIQGSIYVLLQWRLLMMSERKEKKSGPNTLRRWLLILTALQTLLYIDLSIATVKGSAYLNVNVMLIELIKVPFMLSAIFFLVLSTSVFFLPEILYGLKPTVLQAKDAIAGDAAATMTGPFGGGKIYPNDKPKANPQTPVEVDSRLNADMVNSYATSIDHYILASEFFTRQGLTINDLATATDISPRVVSYVINKYFKKRFTDFINSYRLQYIKQRLAQNGWKTLTLEGLAKEAGFSSRSSFFSVFKKAEGVSPSEYLSQIKNNCRALNPAESDWEIHRL